MGRGSKEEVMVNQKELASGDDSFSETSAVHSFEKIRFHKNFL
jgi:hypothetical protein